MFTVPVIVNIKLIKLFVVGSKLKGPGLIIPSNVYGVADTPDTVTWLLSCATPPGVVIASTILVIFIVPDPDAYITL